MELNKSVFKDKTIEASQLLDISTGVSSEAIEPLVSDLLVAFGEDPTREGLLRTPTRVAHMYQELLSGYQTDLKSLINDAVYQTDYQDMVLVRDIKFYSLCEHHLLPFFGKVHVAYIPDGKVIGLSKIPRLVDMFARRLQVQERMTQQIADSLQNVLHPKGIAVMVEGAHLCAMMRGVKKDAARMVTNAFLGDFKSDNLVQQGFFAQLQLHPSTQDDLE